MGDRLWHEIVRAEKGLLYGPGERIFGNALAFLRPFSFSPKFYPTLGALAPPFMEIQEGNSKFVSGHPIFVRKR